MTQMKSSPIVRDIQKALERHTDNEQVYTFAGWELSNTLDEITHRRFEAVAREYFKSRGRGW